MSLFRYFRAGATGHSSTNAYLLALPSFFTYAAEAPLAYGNNFSSRFKGVFADLSACDPFTATLGPSNRAAVLVGSKCVIVAFRGSQGLGDWHGNIAGKFMTNLASGEQVHGGFLAALDALYPWVLTKVNEALAADPARNVFLTGHSLGGAVGTLCAHRFETSDGIHVAGVYTFGAPKVGDSGFKTSYNNVLRKRTFRYVYNNDVLANLPLHGGAVPTPNTTYHHVGTLKKLVGNNPIPNSGHDMVGYGQTMRSRLSSKTRSTSTVPSYLVAGDVTADLFTPAMAKLSSVCAISDSGTQAGFVSAVASARHRDRQVVTAVRDQGGGLKLIAWRVKASNGAIERTGDSANQGGPAESPAIARAGSTNRFVTAHLHQNVLRLTSWSISNNGATLTSKGHNSNSTDAKAKLVRIASMSADRLVTAHRSDGRLLVIRWRLEPNGSLTRLADSGTQAGAVQDLALVVLSGGRVVTPVRSSSGDLKVISWTASDGAVQRRADSGNQAGKATIIRAAADQHGQLVTAVSTGAGALRLIVWRVHATTGAVTRKGDSGGQAGATSDHDVSLANGRIVTGVRDATGALRVIFWKTNANTGSVTRVGTSSGGPGATAGSITQCEALSDGEAVISARSASDGLTLSSWSMP